MSPLAQAQARLERLKREVTDARKSMVELQRSALPAPLRKATEQNRGAVVVASVNVIVMLQPTNTVGFEKNDIVAIVRKDNQGKPFIVGVGKVAIRHEDELQVLVSAEEAPLFPEPEDEAYVISRADSPYSLANYKFAQ